jgi:hypothetical protein
MKELLIGIAGNGVVHTDMDTFDVDTRFRMVKESGVFDYYDKSPPPGEIDVYLRASAKYDLPIRAGGFYYTLGRDEPLLDWHLRVAREIGAVVHNVQIRPLGAEGKPVTDQKVAEICLWAAEMGEKLGVTPCFEVHINMWSEHFGRVARVAGLVEQRGVKFNMTLDHSHVIFKMDNPPEQEIDNLREEIEAGRLVLDPSEPGHVAGIWIENNYVRHAHARAVIPANPVNIWAKHPNGQFGRGVQYPFVKPAAGEWHSKWKENLLEPWKEVMRQLLRHHATRVDSCLGQISTEFIPGIDYGGGARYSIFDNNVACAKWIRSIWADICAGQAHCLAAAHQPPRPDAGSGCRTD